MLDVRYGHLHAMDASLVRAQTQRMGPLDEQQQRRVAELMHDGAIRNRRGAFAFGFVTGGAIGGGAIGGGVGVGEGLSWPLLVCGGLLLALICGALAARLGPESILRHIVRAQVPSKASQDRAVSGFQIDGGRAWKIGERPPPRYWDSWK